MNKLKNKYIIWVVLAAIFFTFLVPIAINELYKLDIGYQTVWGASEVLAYYAELLGGIIAIVVLIITVYFSRKDIKKQLSFAKAQTKVPFFMIETVCRCVGGKSYAFSQVGNIWSDKYVINQYNSEAIKCSICLKNIGDGLALDTNYAILGTDINSLIKFAINQDNLFCIEYDIKKLFVDKFDDKIITIVLSYKNTLGIQFEQKIDCTFKKINKTNEMSVTVDQISTQKVHLD